MKKITKIIIVQHRYSTTSAKTQRMLAAAKEYVKMGVDVVFIVSTKDKEFDRVEGVRFIKIEENREKLLRCFINFIKAIKNEYNEKAAILFYGIPLYAGLFRRRKYRVFAEVTELPLYKNKNEVSFTERIQLAIRFAAVKRFTGMLVISRALKEFYIKLGVKNIEVVNMFVDPIRFSIPRDSNRRKYIAYCGSVSFYKDGVNDLIQAFKIVHDRYPDFDLKIIGGFEDNNVERRLRELVDKNGLANSVIFTGLVNSYDMPKLLKNAEILALARPNNLQAKYGFPTKLGEYLATGNPVVVTKVGEIPNYITDKCNGILAEPENPSDFAEKVIYAIEHPNEAAEIGTRGRNLTLCEFSAKAQTEKALDFISRVGYR